jgi:hypothetical protein
MVLLPVLVRHEYYLAFIRTHKWLISMYAHMGSGGRDQFRAVDAAWLAVRRACGAGVKYACVRHEHRPTVIPPNMDSALHACSVALQELSPPLRRVPPTTMKA